PCLHGDYLYVFSFFLEHHPSQEMIEGGITSRMSGIIENAGHHPSPQDYRLLTTDPSQLREEDLPGDLQSLSWLTSVDVPRLQQMADGRDHNNGSLLQQQTAQINSMPMTGQSSMLHLQSNMQHSPLGISIINSHTGSVMYQPTQQVYSLAQSGQQCSAGGLYSNVSFANQSIYTQPRIAPQEQELQPKTFPKPIYSYSCLIAMALKNSKTGSLPVSEIYSFMKEHFPYFKEILTIYFLLQTAPDGWKNSVRHNLSLNKCFEKVENKASSSSRKGCLWALNPAKIDKMEEEMQKWKRKDLPAIRRSMANPDELDKLITDRPENCRRKALDPSMTRLPTGPPVLPMAAPTHLQCQPIVTLSLPCLPMHQHHQLHSKLQTRLQPMSPAPAQTPPLHVVPDVSHSPLAHQPTKPPDDFYSVQADTHTEVDTLDPSIMDFAFQGNIWEEMKDDSFNLDALGSFSNSPLRLSDCDLGSASVPLGSNTSNLPDVQVTGLYTSYPPQEPSSPQYTHTGATSKPIILL
uniref:Fork-head domain-containing protein n=1 Tax=Periophthalmus magnuspinnatus TaxID=409849 RepID=A0A3B4B1G9_9GOBI